MVGGGEYAARCLITVKPALRGYMYFRMVRNVALRGC